MQNPNKLSLAWNFFFGTSSASSKFLADRKFSQIINAIHVLIRLKCFTKRQLYAIFMIVRGMQQCVEGNTLRLRKGGKGFIHFLANLGCHGDDVMAKYSNTLLCLPW